MKAAITRLTLGGTSRTIEFSAGLNVVRGGIAGKTTVLRLIYGLFGGSYSGLIPEMDRVTYVEGDIVLGSQQFRIARRPVGTLEALVDIFGEGEAARLPAEASADTYEGTYKDWVQRKLALPKFEVFPSERLDVAASPVSVKDYFFYSYLRQSELGTSLLGSSDRFRALKRRAVFAQVWGLTGARYRELEVELRSTERRLNDARARLKAADEMFADSPWANVAALTAAIDAAEKALRTLEQEGAGRIRSALLRGYAIGVSDVAVKDGAVDEGAAATNADPSSVEMLRRHVLQVDDAIAIGQEAIVQERLSGEELETLASQLEAQRKRLSKAIAARSYLLDYDFLQCPRCGSAVDAQRRSTESSPASPCYLCLQNPPYTPSARREDLEEEERRLVAQIVESRSLAANHRASAQILERELEKKRAVRKNVGEQLDARTSTYVSDNASDLEVRAAAEARLRAELEKLRDFRLMHGRLEGYALEERELSKAAASLSVALRAEERRSAESEKALATLDTEFSDAINAVHVPHLDPSEFVAIDRDPDYLGPIVWGRRFPQLYSPGAKTLVNVAFAVAVQRAAIKENRPLANILLIDGLTNSLGDDVVGIDAKLRLWRLLQQTAEEYHGRLQIIVADNDVPPFIEPFVRVTLSAADRLVP